MTAPLLLPRLYITTVQRVNLIFQKVDHAFLLAVFPSLIGNSDPGGMAPAKLNSHDPHCVCSPG